ncbi:MAG: hypothetical protein CMO26_14155 [Thiotrichales bacterium]|nr:hypothetical protein [Thiotrichales bacterium]
MSDSRFDVLESVDVAPLFAGDDVGRRACGEEMLQAFVRSNGFVARHFPHAESIDEQVTSVLDFFSLPEKQRMCLATRRYRPDASHCYRGFFPLPRERGWAHNEIFDFGPAKVSRAPTAHPVKVFLEESNQWPSREPHPGWRNEAEALYVALRNTAATIMRELAVALDGEAESFMVRFADDNGTLRILHYPSPPEDFVAADGDSLPERVDVAGRRIITRRHVDACALSVLWQDAVGGLQYEDRDGSWQEVPAGGGRLSVHAGSALELMSGGRIVSTPHRVVGTGQDRCSMGFFLEPMFSATITTTASGECITYADHMKDDFADLEVYASVMGDSVV